MAGGWILAIDQGTTNTKGVLVDRTGEIVYRASAPAEILQPQAGWVEQNPIALWRSVVKVITECAHHAGLAQRSIAGIAIANQRETALMWRRAGAAAEAAGEPIGNAITWQCRRSAPVCERLRGAAGAIQSTTGLPLDPLLSATKWDWALEQKPELRAMADSGDVLFGTVDAWLLYNLTA